MKRLQAGWRNAKSRRPRAAAPSAAASATPPARCWRPRRRRGAAFLVALVGLGFAACWSAARSTIQIVGTDFYQEQGEKRYAHSWSCRPAAAASSTATARCWPPAWRCRRCGRSRRTCSATREQRRELARLLGMPPAELRRSSADRSARFVWLRRQVDEPSGSRSRRSASRASTRRASTAASTPRARRRRTSSASPTSRTAARKASSWRSRSELQGRDGSRVVVKDRLGRVVEDIGDRSRRSTAATSSCRSTPRCSSSPTSASRDAVAEHKAKAGSVVVLDVQTGEVLALANYPSYDPGDRRNLSGAQLRNRALTDIFEPGSTMKPFIAAWRWRRGRVTPRRRSRPRRGRITITGSTITRRAPARRADGGRGDPEVEQRRHREDGDADGRRGDVGAVRRRSASGQKPQLGFPGAVDRPAAPVQDLAADRAGDDELRLRPVGALFQLARAYTVFARDGELIPVTMLRSRATQPDAGVRVFSPETARAVREMLQPGRRPRRHGAARRRRIGYSVGGKTGTAHKQEGKGYASDKYRSWFVGMAPIEQPAHRRRGDGRRAEQRRVLRRRRRRAGVQPGRAADAAHAGRAARPRREAADRRRAARPCRRASEMAVTALKSPDAAARWLRSWVTGTLRTDSRQVQPGDAFIAWPGLCARRPRASCRPRWPPAPPPAWSSATASSAFGFDDARIASLPGLKARTGEIADAFFDQPERSARRASPSPAPTARPRPPGGWRRR